MSSYTQARKAEEEILVILQKPGDRVGQGPVWSRQPPCGGKDTPTHTHTFKTKHLLNMHTCVV